MNKKKINASRIVLIFALALFLIVVIYLFIQNINHIYNEGFYLDKTGEKFYIKDGFEFLNISDILSKDGSDGGGFELGVNVTIEHVNPDNVAKAIWMSLLNSICFVTDSVASVLILAIQNIIFFLFDGKIFYSALDISYESYLIFIIVVFIVALIVFLFIRFLTFSKKKNRTKSVGFSIIYGITIIAMIPLVFQLLFLFTQYLLEHVFNIDWSEINITNLIDEAVGNSLEPHSLDVREFPYEYHTVIYDVPVNIVGSFVFMNSTISATESVQIVLAIFAVWFITYFFIKFFYRLLLRVIELFFLGILIFPIVVASSAEDDGARMIDWSQTIVKKIFAPFIMLISYIVLVIFTSEVLLRVNTDIDLIYSMEGFSEVMSILFLIFPFIVLDVISNKWVFSWTKQRKENINVQISKIISEQTKMPKSYGQYTQPSIPMIPGANSANFTNTTQNNFTNATIQQSIPSNNSAQQRDNGVSLSNTIEKINRRDNDVKNFR